MSIAVCAIASILGSACGIPCARPPYLRYQANASAPRLFFTHEDRALFFATTAAAPHVLFEFDGTKVKALDKTLEHAPLTWGTYQGSAVVLTETGLFRLSTSFKLERMTTLTVTLPNSPQRIFPVGFLVEFQGRLLFPGADDTHRALLWAYDPRSDELEKLEVPEAQVWSLAATEAQIVGGALVFNLGDPESWWVYDGTAFHILSHRGHAVWPGRSGVMYQGALWLNVDGGVGAYDGTSLSLDASAGDLVPVGVVGSSLFLWGSTPNWGTSATAQLWVRDSAGYAQVPLDVSWCKQAGNFVADQRQLSFACDVPYPADPSRALMSYDVASGHGRILLAQGDHTTGAGDLAFSSGVLLWRGDLLFASTLRPALVATKEQSFDGDGLEPWIYRADGGVASMIEDLYPGTTLTRICSD